MNPLPLFLIILSLPLLLGGCGEKGVNRKELKADLELPDLIYYLKGSDTPYTGKAFTLYKNGKKESNQNYKDGKLHGLFISWRNNGKKWSEGNYKDGEQEGLQTLWHENGQKLRELNYKDGKKEGLQMRWYYNGQKWSEFLFKNGKGNGLAVVWHKNGQKSAEKNFEDDELISAKYWNSKGEPVDSEEE